MRTSHKKKLNLAIKAVLKAMNNMSAAKLHKELDKYENDPRTDAILYAWNYGTPLTKKELI